MLWSLWKWVCGPLIVVLSSSAALGQHPCIEPPGTAKKNVENYWTPERMRAARPMPMPQPGAEKGAPLPSEVRKQETPPPVGPAPRLNCDSQPQ
jgi:hypothetical protein